ncbi:polyadenylate-binding protein-interacting protein 5-like isoform X2 [Alnus glutinosa]|uniref:polyadenylate-binding protein-interacting protein 5-like isoform X2 n=1 Tax=Alnus glutinosa TaxID=3517 RepID=UPI002D76E61F|nr:polyadenylate-binding protein-interacting protein 5-like isoform X2 [Alnus glutinosa]
MKPRVSSLNPHAASYIPLSQRDANDRTYVTAKDYKSGNESVRFGAPDQLYSKFSLNPNAYGTEKNPSREVFTVKSHPAHSYSSPPQNVNQATDKQILDEEFDMDFEYLQMTFPGLSDQSLNDVYLANNGDLEATVDMLNQLEPLTNSLTSDYDLILELVKIID